MENTHGFTIDGKNPYEWSRTTPDQTERDAYRMLISHKGKIDNAIADGRSGEDVTEILKHWKSEKDIQFGGGQGNTYTVAIKPDADQFLDWDKPLSEQSPKVQEALKNVRGKDPEMTKHAINQKYGVGAYLYSALAGQWDISNDSGKSASAALLKAGIRGIRFLDQGSRQQGDPFRYEFDDRNQAEANEKLLKDSGKFTTKIEREGDKWVLSGQPNPTHNYVIFDHNDIDITHRNGEPVGAGKPQHGVAYMPDTELKGALKSEWDKYADTGEYTFDDLVGGIDAALSESRDSNPDLENAIEKYREEKEYDRKLAGRGDMDQAEREFEEALIKIIDAKFMPEPTTTNPATRPRTPTGAAMALSSSAERRRRVQEAARARQQARQAVR
jgi:hypothetical protein